MSSNARKHPSTSIPYEVFFPDEEPEEHKVSEHLFHMRVRTLLFDILEQEFGSIALLGSDQFIYWDPTTSKKSLSPDVMLRLNTPHEDLGHWKTWVQGAPDVAVEIVSPSDTKPRVWNDKMERYNHVRVRELVRFNPADEKRPLRIWEWKGSHLVERTFQSKVKAKSRVLDLWWVVMLDERGQRWLRLSRDPFGQQMLPSRSEYEKKRAEQEHLEKEKEHALREAAEQEREQERLQREAAEQEREQERLQREAAEQEREQERLQREAAEHEREQERLQREAAEQRIRELEALLRIQK